MISRHTIHLISLFVVFLATFSGCHGPQHSCYRSGEQTAETVVQLRYLPLPEPVLDKISVHYYFVVKRPKRISWERFEIWRVGPFYETLGEPEGSEPDTGHLRYNFFAVDADVGGGDAVVSKQWTGAAAESIIDVLTKPEAYPHRRRYWGWPGPNSNTWAAWVLKQANVSADLDPRAIGKDWHSWFGAGITTTRTGIQLETPLIGFKIGILDGIELHVLTLTFGIDFWLPAIKTPIGRFGMNESIQSIAADDTVQLRP